MKQGRIVIITGSPGTGKTTTASIIAEKSDLKNNFLIYLLFYSVKEKNNIYLSYYLAVFIIFITDIFHFIYKWFSINKIFYII